MDTTKTKILFLASRPKGTGANLEWDLLALERALDTTRTQDRFLIRHIWSPTSADLVDGFIAFKPDIVHFSGHGQQGAGLVLTDRASEPAVITEESFLSLLRGLREDRPKLLFLASCWGMRLARSATQLIGCAVGCPDTLPDAVATGFIHGFYTALASQKSVQDAYEFGRGSIPGNVQFDHRPMLECAHDVDPSKLVIFGGTESDIHLNYREVERLLDLGLFSEAAFRSDLALKTNPADGRMMFLLAISRMNGRMPRNLGSVEEAKVIESLLERGLRVNASTAGSPPVSESWEGSALLLWAWIKEDLFARNGFISEGPHFEFLLQRATALRPSKGDLARIARIFPQNESSRSRSFLDYLMTI